jgi:hypothetical protein
MESIKNELVIRKSEIDSYINLLHKIEPSTSSIISSIDDLEESPIPENRIGRPKAECGIQNDLKKILKANLYILLYNITEAFLKQSILNVLNRIDDQYTYAHLSEPMKILWLEKCVKWFKYQSPEVTSSQKSRENYYAKFINELQGKLLVFLTEEDKTDKKVFAEKFGIPGNVDHNIFKQIAKEYGVSLNDGRLHNKAAELDNLRVKRNNLAHGNVSFSEFGQSLSILELVILSDNIFEYLNKTADMFDTYLVERKYLNNP